MGDPFLGEIRIVGFNYAPQGWALCNGQLLPINQNQALFSLLGTTFGGNGQVNFALPNLQGRTPIHFNNIALGERGGESAHTLTSGEMPAHTHFVTGSTRLPPTDDPNSVPDAIGAYFGRTSFPAYHAPTGGIVAMDPQCLSPTGGSQAHNNMSPYLVLNFIIATQGIFPSPN